MALSVLPPLLFDPVLPLLLSVLDPPLLLSVVPPVFVDVLSFTMPVSVSSTCSL